MKALLALLILFVSSFAFASDAKTEFLASLKKANQLMEKASSISMKMHYALFEDHQSSTPMETHIGRYLRSGKQNFKMEVYGTLTIQNKEVILVKDDSNNVIMVSRPNPSNYFKLPGVDLEKVIGQCNAVTKFGSDSTLNSFRVELTGSSKENEKLEMHFNRSTGMLVKMTVYMKLPAIWDPLTGKEVKKNPRLEVSYLDIDLNNSIPESLFSTTAYIQKVNGKWSAGKNFSDYEFLDQTNALSKK